MFNRKHMRRFYKRVSGFSLIEMLVATVLVMILSATSYRVLTSQGNRQKETVYSQKKNAQINAALDRFKRDIRAADPLWFDYGIAWAYPHQGHQFSKNFYVDVSTQVEGLNDAITLLTRDNEKGEIHNLNATVEYPTPSPGSTNLIGSWVALAENTTEIAPGDWVMLFKPGKYVLAVVTGVRGTPKQLMLRMPNAIETQLTQDNVWGRSSGYVKRIGVVPGNFDWDGNNTASPDDDSIKLEANVTKVQVVKPVSYRIDYATTDGLPHSHGNQYILDENGQKKKMIVRSEFIPPGLKHEYLAEATQLGITYDVLKSTDDFGADSLQGYTDGDIIRDVGRESNTSVQFVNLALAPDDSEGFISTSRIVSVRMFMSSDTREDEKVNQNYNELRVALDPNRQDDQYQEDGKSWALSSGSLADSGLDFTGKQIGQPLYLKPHNGTNSEMYVPGTGNVDVVVPVSNLNFADGTFEQGKLILFKDDGSIVDSDPQKSEIQFNPGADSYFYPSSMTESTLPGSNNTTVFIGGFSVSVDNSQSPPVVTRTPTMAKITFPSSQTFREYVEDNNNLGSFAGTNGKCSLAGCELKTITNFAVGSSGNRLKDTSAGISVDNNGDVYVASITRTQGVDTKLSIYKTNNSMTNPFTEIVVDDGNNISNNRVITAMAQEPIYIGNDKYQAICTSRSINQANMANPPEDGKILLYKLNGTPTAPIEVATHNSKCKTLTTMNNSLVVAGNLVTQVVKEEEVVGRVNGTLPSPKVLYTAEIANYIEATNTKIYADGYYTLPAAYVSPVQSPQEYQNALGGNTGFSGMKIDPLTFGVVMGNKSHLSVMGPLGVPRLNEQQDFTTMTVNFGGMTERVIASIDPNLENLNASGVVTKYGEGESKIPAILLPGNLYYDENNPRETPPPLPAMATTMGEDEWFNFYQDYTDVLDRSINNPNSPNYDPSGTPSPVYLPDPATAIFQCGNSVPPTCQGGG